MDCLGARTNYSNNRYTIGEDTKQVLCLTFRESDLEPMRLWFPRPILQRLLIREGRRVNRNLHASSWYRSVFSLMVNIVLTSLGRSAHRQSEHTAYAPARKPSQNREFLMARAA
jgi:hypothetical protein